MNITVECLIKSDPESVWNAWINPDDITRWNAASDDWHTPEARVDFRVGGRRSWTTSNVMWRAGINLCIDSPGSVMTRISKLDLRAHSTVTSVIGLLFPPGTCPVDSRTISIGSRIILAGSRSGSSRR